MTTDSKAAMAALEKAQSVFDSATASSTTLVQPWSQELVKFLSLSVLGFSCLALILSTALLWRAGAPPQHVLKVFGLISIIGLSAVLLVVGYSNEQLTPIVGLFGAIAGYLLGKDTKLNKDE